MVPSTKQSSTEALDVTTTQQRDATTQTIRVAFQGERGAFGDEAVQVYFGQAAGLKPVSLPYRSFAEVFCAVSVGEVNSGLVPAENSQVGIINEVYDLLRQHDLFVVGEIAHRDDSFRS